MQRTRENVRGGPVNVGNIDHLEIFVPTALLRIPPRCHPSWIQRPIASARSDADLDGGDWIAPGVLENLGAGAGWVTPSTRTKASRATLCG